MKTSISIIAFFFLFTSFCYATEWELCARYSSAPPVGYYVVIAPDRNSTFYDLAEHGYSVIDPGPNFPVTKKATIYADFNDNASQDIDGTIKYGIYAAVFIKDTIIEGELRGRVLKVATIDFRDADYTADLADPYSPDQDFEIIYNTSTGSVTISRIGGSYITYGQEVSDPSATIYSLAGKTQNLNGFKNIRLSVNTGSVTMQVGSANYQVSSGSPQYVSGGSGNVTITSQNRMRLLPPPLPNLYLNFSSWDNGLQFDTVRTITASVNLTSLTASYILNFQDCSISGVSSFAFSSNQTYTAYHQVWGQPTSFEYYWYIKYDNNGTWQDLGQGSKNFSFTPIHSSFELKCYLKDKVFNIGVWSPVKRVEYTPLTVTIDGPGVFTSKILLTYTAMHQPYSGLIYDWWIKYDFNGAWQRLGGGLQTKSIMSTPDPAYSFYIKCYVRTAADTVGVCSNEQRVVYDDIPQIAFSGGMQSLSDNNYVQATDTETKWWPVHADRLTLSQKIAILLPIEETVKDLTHRFRWKESDPFIAGNDSALFDEASSMTKEGVEEPLRGNKEIERTKLSKSGSENETMVPYQFALGDNYPNPFNPSTTITFEIARASVVKLTIYNSLGQTVRALYEGTKSQGRYDIYWDGKNDQGIQVPSGMYIYRLEAGDFTQSKKMMLVK